MDNKNNEAVDGVVASEEISLEEQQAVLEKFDQESNTRNVTGFAKGFIKWYAIAMAVFHVYTSFFGLWATIRQRAMHLLFVMPLCYLMYPAKKGGARNNPSLLDWVFAALSFVCCGYIVVNYDAIFLRGGLPNQMDIIMGCLCALESRKTYQKDCARSHAAHTSDIGRICDTGHEKGHCGERKRFSEPVPACRAARVLTIEV